MKTLRNSLAAWWAAAICAIAFVFFHSLALGQTTGLRGGTWRTVQAIGAPGYPGGKANAQPTTKFQFVEILARLPQAELFIPENAAELS